MIKLSFWEVFLPLLLLFGTLCRGTHVSTLPQFTWRDNRNIRLLFPNGTEESISLWPAEEVGGLRVSCLFEGVVESDGSSSVAVSGCENDTVVNVVIYTSRLQEDTMFNIRNGVTEQVEKVRSTSNIGKIKKRSVSLEDDYDEVSWDAPHAPDPPLFLSLDVQLAFEDSLVAKLGTEEAAREYIARVFTLGKHHMRHASLKTSIHLKPQGPIRRIVNENWSPTVANLKQSMNYKEQNSMPVTYFCNSNDEGNVMGISYKRRACHEKKGVAIVNYQDDLNKASQTYIHECGHWVGFDDDAEYDDRHGTACEGLGIMSSLMTEGGRPYVWTVCNSLKMKKWYNNQDLNTCVKDDTKVQSALVEATYEKIVNLAPKCDTVIVSGADYADCNGEYKVSANERVNWLPSRPVYVHISKELYIFWNARGYGWSIGGRDHLQTGSYYHYSRLDSQEPWEGPWSNGISVECKEVEPDLEALPARMQAMHEMMTTMQSTIEKLENCLSDVTSPDCPSSASGKTAISSGIITNAAGIAANTAAVSVNTGGITANAAGITANAAGLSGSTVGITANSAGITANSAALATKCDASTCTSIESATAKIESCLGDVTSPDCPLSKSNKIGMSKAIIANTDALDTKCDASKCDTIIDALSTKCDASKCDANTDALVTKCDASKCNANTNALATKCDESKCNANTDALASKCDASKCDANTDALATKCDASKCDANTDALATKCDASKCDANTHGIVEWVHSTSKSTSCDSVCKNRGKKCNRLAIKTATLDSTCSTLLKLFPGKKCKLCSPNDSTNTYCFPGNADGSSTIYYHTSFDDVGSYTCQTIPERRINSVCPCEY